MLRLLPPVCHDCGRGAETVALSPYLDFLLCGPCVEKRERALFADTAPRARSNAQAISAERAPSKASASEDAAGEQGPVSGQKRAPRRRKGSGAGAGRPKPQPGKKGGR